MSKGLIPNWNDTYGIKIDTDIYDHVMPYKVSVYDTETGEIIASIGCQNLSDLISTIVEQMRWYIVYKGLNHKRSDESL